MIACKYKSKCKVMIAKKKAKERLPLKEVKLEVEVEEGTEPIVLCK